MQLRSCGSSDLKLPVLGMGCWAYGGGEYWGPQNQQDVDAVVRSAVDHGCNFFDTAEAYNGGASESSLGAALQGLPRERIILGTKISPSNTEPRQVVEHCDASLRRLQTDYIDLYMVHWPITPRSIEHFTSDKIAAPSVSAAFDALQRLQQAGKVRYLGVSNFGPTKLAEALATGARIIVNELPYSLLTRAVEHELLPYCKANGIGVLAYMALLQGVLSDKYPALMDLPPSRRRTRHFDSRTNPLCRHGLPGAEEETAAALAAIRAVAHRLGTSTSDLALRWAIAGEGVTSCLCGSRNVAALQANIAAAEQPLDPAIRAELNQIAEPLSKKLGPSVDLYENPANDRTK